MELVVNLAWAVTATPTVHRLAVTARPGTSGRAVQRELERLVGSPLRATVAGVPLEETRLGTPPLVEAAVLLLGSTADAGRCARGADAAGPEALPSLRVVAGANAGAVVALRRGRQWLVPGPVPRTGTEPGGAGTVELTMDDSGVRIARSPEPLGEGDRVRCGGSWLELQLPSPAGPAERLITWPAVAPEADADPSHVLAVAPPGSTGTRLGLALGLLPLVIGVSVTVLTGMWFFLLFSALGAVAAVVSWWGGAGARRRHRVRVNEALRRDLARCRAAAPPVAVLAWQLQDLAAGAELVVEPRAAASEPPGRWICLGWGPRPSAVAVGGPDVRSPTHPRGPVLVELTRLRHLAVLAAAERRQGILNALALQLCTGTGAVRHLVVDPAADWRPPADPAVLVAPPGRDDVPEAPFLEVLSPAVAATRPARRDAIRIIAAPVGAAAGGATGGDTDLGRHATEAATLTVEAHAALTATLTTTAARAVAGLEPAAGEQSIRLSVDTVSDAVLAGALAAWRGVRARLPGTGDGELPGFLGSHDLFEVPDAIPLRWARHGRTPGLRTPVGRSRHGVEHVELGNDHPHLLIAGTTGCGKSEVLRTLVAGWASRYPPERLEFLFIDFKGGAALAPLTGLPHASTLLTDLGVDDVRRALEFLRAELRRRERLLAALGVADFQRLLRTATPVALPLRELVIVVDEVRMFSDAFATAGDQLARIATVGRSLGIHLVLATQRPQGALPADVRANVTQAVCLRVRTEQDSADVIGAGVAATLPAATAGRGYLDRGHGPPVEFQAALLTSCGERAREVVRVRLLDHGPAGSLRSGGSTTGCAGPVGPVASAGSPPTTSSSGRDGGTIVAPAVEPGADGVAVVTRQLAHAFAASGLPRPADLPAPVPPPLPERVIARAFPGLDLDLGPAENSAEHWTGRASWRPVHDGPLALIGSPRHTRDALLALLRQALGRGAALYVLASTPDTERCAQKWLHAGLLRGVTRSREPAGLQRILECLTVGSERFHEASRCGGDVAPAVVAVEDWDRWCAVLRSSAWAHLEEDLTNLLATGEHRGIVALMTGDRTLSVGRASGVGRTRLYLPADHVPDALLQWPRLPALRAVPGRGALQGASAARCVPTPGAASEAATAVTQLPLVDEQVRSPVEADRAASSAARDGRSEPLVGWAAGGAGDGPDRIWPCYAPLPEQWPGPATPVPGLLMGLGEGHEPVASPWEPGATLVVAGPARSGRSMFLEAVAGHLSDHRVLAVRPGTEAQLDTALRDGSRWPEGARATTVVIDDADLLPVPVLRRLAQLWQPGVGAPEGSAGAVSLVVAVRLTDALASTFPPLLQWRHVCEILLLRPQRPFDADQFGVSLLGRPLGGPAGRGYWIRRGEVHQVQTPWPSHGAG